MKRQEKQKGNGKMTSENVIQYYTLEEAEKIIDFRRARELQRKKEKIKEALEQKILGITLATIGIISPFVTGDGTASIVLIPMGLAVVLGKIK